MSKETIEEAAERLKIKWEIDRPSDFIKGATWKAERMYSEEDIRKAFNDGQDNLDHNPIEGWYAKLTESEWFEQFKKQKS